MVELSDEKFKEILGDLDTDAFLVYSIINFTSKDVITDFYILEKFRQVFQKDLTMKRLREIIKTLEKMKIIEVQARTTRLSTWNTVSLQNKDRLIKEEMAERL